MANSILSNYAANVATRNLAKSSTMVSASVARLSSGQRIISAKDDAAALAIGSKLRSEVDSLRQAQINAGQATAMLQIADGALTEVDNILVRMKALAVQAGSEQISNDDRTRINNEFTQLKNEIDRIANDTKFNGQQLLAGDISFSGIGTHLSGTGTSFDGTTGIVGIELIGETIDTANANTYTVAYDATGGSQERLFTITLANADAGEASVFVGTLPTADYSGSITLQGSGGDGTEYIRISFNSAFDEATDFTGTRAFTAAQGTTSSFTYKVGTGTTAAEDEITVTLDAVTASGLGLTSAIDITTKANADTASTTVSTAIDTVATARAKLGAFQSRFDFAAANLGTNIENSEAARSALLDVDVASEVSKFTSQQILVQAGVSMLSQAQTLPQNLLRLFQ